MDDKPTILVLHAGHAPGGVCRRLYLNVEGLLAQGHRVHLVSATGMRARPHPELHEHRLITPFKKPRGFLFWLVFSIWSILSIPWFAVRFRVRNVVVSHPVYSLYFALLWVLGLVKVTLFLRAVPERSDPAYDKSFSGSLRYFFASSGLRFTSKIIVGTSEQRKQLGKLSASLERRTVVLPTPVIYSQSLKKFEDAGGEPSFDIEDGGLVSSESLPKPVVSKEQWKGWLKQASVRKKLLCKEFDLPERSFVLMTSGELSARKNAELILRAMSDSENDSFSLIISGEGEERDRLSSLAAGFGLARRVRLPSWLDNFMELIGGCDLFVMPSPHQGISNSMLEALGAGVPVIAADTPEMREVLEYSELLFDPGHVGELAKKLNLIQGHKAELRKIHDLSLERSRVLSFDLGREVSRLLS